MVLILFFLFIFITPQVRQLLPEQVTVGPFSVHVFDVFSGLAFVWWVHSFFIRNQKTTRFQAKLNNLYIIVLGIGLIPIIVGGFCGKEDLLGLYRFFFYFVWVPVLVRFLQNPICTSKVVYFLIIINLTSVVIALFNHFSTMGFELYYLNIHHEMILFALLISLSLGFHKKYLFRNKTLSFIISFLLLAALLIDHSRKMYLSFAVSSLFLFINSIKAKTGTERRFSFFLVIMMFLLVVGMLNYFGWTDEFESRVKSIGILPGITDVRRVDESIGYRIKALEAGLRIVGKHPLFGTGTGESKEFFDKIEEERIYYGFDYQGYSPHNYYLSMLVSFGIPITISICCIIYYLLRLSWNNINNKVSENNIFIAKGMFWGFIGFFIAMFFEGFEIITMLDMWLFLGLLLSFASVFPNQPLQAHTSEKHIEAKFFDGYRKQAKHSDNVCIWYR